MTFLIIAIGILAAGLLSWALTRYFLSYALDRGIMDIPNGRSSHVTPKPRAGGWLWARFTVHYTPKHGSWLNPG